MIYFHYRLLCFPPTILRVSLFLLNLFSDFATLFPSFPGSWPDHPQSVHYDVLGSLSHAPVVFMMIQCEQFV